MKPEELTIEMTRLKDEYELAVRKLKRRYAFEHNLFQVDSVIEDDSGIKIRVKKVTAQLGYLFSTTDVPYCSYTGPRLKKDGTEYLSGEVATVIQSRLITTV